jgi:hypothetical protein
MTNEELLGKIGELIVNKYLGGILSNDKYDAKKDITLQDGTLVEVKTQPRYVKRNCFTIEDTKAGNQLQKCINVHRLFFVEPGKNHKIRIYECIDRTYFVDYVHRGNYLQKVFCFDVNKMILHKEYVHVEQCTKITELTKTDPKWFV